MPLQKVEGGLIRHPYNPIIHIGQQTRYPSRGNSGGHPNIIHDKREWIRRTKERNPLVQMRTQVY